MGDEAGFILVLSRSERKKGSRNYVRDGNSNSERAGPGAYSLYLFTVICLPVTDMMARRAIFTAH